MATHEQRRLTRDLYKKGYTIKEIAVILNSSSEEVRWIIYPPRKKEMKRKPVRPEKIIKIREEYNIMLENGYKPKYIREELSRWHHMKPATIYRIISGLSYKNVKMQVIKDQQEMQN